MRRTKQEAAITREKILHAALSVFSNKGYSATTLEDIAHEAGVTRGAVYWHFGGKAELYKSLLREFSSRLTSIAMQAHDEGGTFKEVLGRIFIRLLSSIEDDKELRAIMEIALFKTELTPELESGIKEQIKTSRELIASITSVMRQGVRLGELRSDLDPTDMARAYVALEYGTIYMYLADSESVSLKENSSVLADILITGISNHGMSLGPGIR